MSPAAVTIGAATLSRSRLRLAQNAATATVSTSTTTDERIAPITEMTMKSTIEIDRPCTNSVATSPWRAPRARPRSTATSTIAARHVLADQRVDAAATGGTCRRGSAVPSRLPSAAEDVAPHPDRGRDRMSRPGKQRSSVWVIEASVRPVTRSPPEEIRSAKKPAGLRRSPRARARRSARRHDAGSEAWRTRRVGHPTYLRGHGARIPRWGQTRMP